MNYYLINDAAAVENLGRDFTEWTITHDLGITSLEEAILAGYPYTGDATYVLVFDEDAQIVALLQENCYVLANGSTRVLHLWDPDMLELYDLMRGLAGSDDESLIRLVRTPRGYRIAAYAMDAVLLFSKVGNPGGTPRIEAHAGTAIGQENLVGVFPMRSRAALEDALDSFIRCYNN